MQLSMLLLGFLAALAAAAPPEETLNVLLARTCPGGDGATCCPEGQFSVRRVRTNLSLCAECDRRG